MNTQPPHRRLSVAGPRIIMWFVLVTAGYAVATTGIGWWGAATEHVVGTVIIESLLFVIFLVAMLRLLIYSLVRPWQSAAIHDELTGVLRAGPFWERAERRIAEAISTHRPAAFVFLDLDDFKQVNDRYGHAVGDAVLQSLGRILRQSVRAGDLLGRLGGEEFGWFMVNVTPEDAALAAERVIAQCQDAEVVPLRGFSLSGGVATVPADRTEHLTAWDVGRLADYALYQAKAQGKGRIVQWGA